MPKRRAKKTDPNDDQELKLAFNPATGLMDALEVVPRSPDNPVPPRKRRTRKEK